MEISNFTITKRDGSKDSFSLDKIMNAIVKAFESVDEPTDLGTISKILSHLDIKDDIKVEDIQNQVEEGLMREGHYKVAKSFMLYRQQHTEGDDNAVPFDLKLRSGDGETVRGVDLNTETGLLGNGNVAVLVFKTFVGNVLAPLNIAVHNFKNAEIGAASRKLKCCRICDGT